MRPIDPHELATRIGRRIVELRRANGWTQAEFAERMGCSVQYVGMVERGLENLTLAKLAGIATVLDAGIDDVLRKPRARSMVVRKGRPKKS